VRIDTASVNNGIPALSVHGALSDHHRLIRQFGAVPLMYYLFGETWSPTRQRWSSRDRSTDRSLQNNRQTTKRVGR